MLISKSARLKRESYFVLSSSSFVGIRRINRRNVERRGWRGMRMGDAEESSDVKKSRKHKMRCAVAERSTGGE